MPRINPKTSFLNTAVKLGMTLTLAALTYLILQTLDRYESVAVNILPNLAFDSDGMFWSTSSPGVTLVKSPLPVAKFHLAQPPKPLVLGRVISDPQRFTHIRVAADFKVDNIIPGNVWWERGGVILRSRDKHGQKIRFWPTMVATFSGTADWARYDGVVPVPDNAHLMQLLFFLDGRAGRMEVANISVDAVTPTLWFRIAKYALIGGWVLLGVWIFIPSLYAARQRPTAYFALAAFLATLVAVLTPQPNLSNTTAKTIAATISFLEPLRTLSDPAQDSATVAGQAEQGDATAQDSESSRVSDETPTTPATDTRFSASLSERFTQLTGMTPREFTAGGGARASHIISHAVFSFFTILAFPFAAPVLLFVSLSIAALTTETLQLFVTTRSTSMDDLTMNVLGVICGVIFAYTWRFITQQRRTWLLQRLRR